MGFKNQLLILIFFGKIEKNRSQTTSYLNCLFTPEKIDLRQKVLPKILDFSSHRILWHMHGVLNIDENKN